MKKVVVLLLCVIFVVSAVMMTGCTKPSNEVPYANRGIYDAKNPWRTVTVNQKTVSCFNVNQYYSYKVGNATVNSTTLAGSGNITAVAQSGSLFVINATIKTAENVNVPVSASSSKEGQFVINGVTYYKTF